MNILMHCAMTNNFDYLHPLMTAAVSWCGLQSVFRSLLRFAVHHFVLGDWYHEPPLVVTSIFQGNASLELTKHGPCWD